MLQRFLIPLVQIALPVALGWWLCGHHSTGNAVGIAAGVFAALSLLGCVLLRLSAEGRVTWMNRLGSRLLPFAWRFGRGSLARMAFGATALQTILAAGGALARDGSGAMLVLAAAWTVDGIAVLWIAHLLHGYRFGSSGANGLVRVILFLVIVIAASAVLHHFGWTWLGALVAGLPPVCAGSYYGLYMLVFVFGSKNRRWN